MNETKKAVASDEPTSTTLRTELRDLSPAGEALSMSEIELVAGGICKPTKPGMDDGITCVGGRYD